MTPLTDAQVEAYIERTQPGGEAYIREVAGDETYEAIQAWMKDNGQLSETRGL